MSLIEIVNVKLSVFTVLSQVFILLAVVYLLFLRNRYEFIPKFFSKYGLLLAFVVALASTLGSLFYSEIAGYSPCVLCWYQRIFMYPQVVILGMAMVKKDKKIMPYAFLLSLIGALLAGYHYLMQLNIIDNLPCPVVGYSVSCTKLFVMQFGYITLPLMSLTAFLLIIVFLMLSKVRGNEE